MPEDRREERRFRVDGTVLLSILLQLVIGIGLLFAMNQKVNDLKEYTTNAIQDLKQDVREMRGEFERKKP